MKERGREYPQLVEVCVRFQIWRAIAVLLKFRVMEKISKAIGLVDISLFRY